MANVVITGANRGIGLALTKRYVEAGDTVFALCRDPGKADELKAIGPQVKIGTIDIGDRASIEAAARAIDAPVDILVNNAGILGGADQGLDTIDLAEWLDAFNVMTIGPFLVTRAFVPHLAKRGGKVLCTSSQLASSAWPYGGYYGYASAKAAGNRVAQILALDLKDKGIVVASVHPGYVQTDMSGPSADITPAESAAGIYDLIAGLTPEKSGGFFKWNGEVHPA
jgi:NAD(P)-dependent dehydrogenase (short-subunit alcohol dehydrogenase family)